MDSDPPFAELDDVLTTQELERRPSRPPDLEAENQALLSLADELASRPRNLLQKLVETVLEVCRADSAGISIFVPGDDGGSFHWDAVAGKFAHNVGGSLPRDESPCGRVVDRDSILLFEHPERHYDALANVEPAIVESLLAPFYVEGRATGTLWALGHTPERRFDAEDARLLSSLSRFASAGYQVVSALGEATTARDHLEEKVRERTGELEREVAEHRMTEAQLRDSEGRLNRQLEDALVLQQVSAELIPEQDPDALYDHLARALQTVMRSDAVSIQVLDPEGDALLLLASRGFAPESERFWERVEVAAASVCRAALDAGGRIVIEDVRDPAAGFIGSPDADEWRRSGLRAVQSTPLLSRGGECLGMISTHWAEPHVPSTDDLGRLDVLARQAADLIERSRAEARLKDSEERLRLFGDAASSVIWTRGAEGLHWEYLSPAFKPIYGRERASVLGGDDLQTWSELIVPEDRERALAAIERVRSGDRMTFEYRIRRPDGEVRWLRDTDFPIRAADGSVRSIGGIGQDITEQKRAETALRESEEKYRTLFNSMDEAYAVVEVLSDDAGRWSDFLFLEVNPAFVEHTGMEYPVGQTATQLLGQPNPQWAEIYGRVAETGEPVRTEEAEPRLERIFDLNIFRVGGPGSRRVAVLFTDITERKQAEQALLDSEARLRAIADLVPDLLWRSDPAGATSWCNQRWLEYTGQSAEEALGDGWAEVIHPGDREASLRRFRGAVDAGEPLRQEHRIRSAKGAYRWFLVEAHPVRDENGEITQWFGAATDVHEERLALQAAQEASLAKGQFLAVMSHELRTPLTGVIGFADLLENEVLGPLAAKQQEALSRIKASSWHLVAIIDEILTLSRVEAGKEQVHREATDVAAITCDVVGILEPPAEGDGLTLRMEGGADPLPVWTDPGKVRQVLINLVGNAIKYTGAGEVEVRLDRSDPQWLRVHVRDTGPGIAPEDQERIFEAFTQLDGSHTRTGSGTGLGLAICRRLARLLGGDVTLRSAIGEGSTFTFHLPRQEGEV